MKFVIVEELPKRTRKKRLSHIFDEFMRMNVKIVKYEFTSNEYKHVSSASSNLRKGVRSGGYPIDVKQINNEIYFIRRDM